MLRHLLWTPHSQARARLRLPILGRPALQFQLRWLRRNGVSELLVWENSGVTGSEAALRKLTLEQETVSISTLEELWRHGARLEVEQVTGHGFLSDLGLVTDLGLVNPWTIHLNRGSALTELCSGPDSEIVFLCGDLALLRSLAEADQATNLSQLAETFRKQGIKVDRQDVSGIYKQEYDHPESLLALHRDLLREGDIANLPPVNERGLWQGKRCFVHPETDLVPPIWLSSEVTIARGARLYGPVVVGPQVTIGEGALLEDCVIAGNTVLSAGGVVRGCIWGIPLASPGGFLDQGSAGV